MSDHSHDEESAASAAVHALEEQLRFREQALSLISSGIVVTDPSLPDNPILYANDAFAEVTGYAVAEILNRNCRFLQGPETDPEAVRVMREAIAAERSVTVTLLNYRKDGSTFWNEVRIHPARDESGRVSHFVGTVTDVTNARESASALRASEDLVHLLLASTAEAIYGLDRDGVCTFCNPTCASLLGYKEPADLVGKHLHGLIHHTHADGTPYPVEECHVHRALRERRGTHIADEVLWRADGTSFPVEYWSYPMVRSDELVGCVVTFLDISERLEARAALEERNHVLETVQAINLALAGQLEQDRLVQQVTDAATTLTGAAFGAFFYNVQDTVGDSYMLYTLSGIPRERFADFPMPRATDLFGPTFRGEGVVRIDDVALDPRYGNNDPYRGMPEGHPRVTSFLAVPVIGRSREVIGGLFFGHPEPGRFHAGHERLAEGVAAQAAVAIDNARLFDRAQHGKLAAEEANRRKDEFLALLGHELRNPLAPISNATAMLRAKGDDPATVARASDILERQTVQIAKLVDDLLDASRIDQGKVRLIIEDVDLAALVRDAVGDHRPSFESSGLQLSVDVAEEMVWVRGDRTRLLQIVGNMLDNARKFTPRGGSVAVAVALDTRGQARVSVVDAGVGMDEETLARVFESFAQGDRSLDRQQGGLGLGMFVAREMARRHGGEVTATSPGLDQGATFSFSMPSSAAADQQPGRLASERSDRLRRLLVIDDNRDSADSLAELLRIRGHEVRTAYDGNSGLAAAKQFKPDILLCDVGLPDMDGYQIARSMTSDPELQDCLKVAVTGYGRSEDKRDAEEAGFDRHIVKPMKLADLEAILAEQD